MILGLGGLVLAVLHSDPGPFTEERPTADPSRLQGKARESLNSTTVKRPIFPSNKGLLYFLSGFDETQQIDMSHGPPRLQAATVQPSVL
jgi:hypothetical protein